MRSRSLVVAVGVAVVAGVTSVALPDGGAGAKPCAAKTFHTERVKEARLRQYQRLGGK
jgi:hypothetical protein